jgi:hypothetical protein
MGEWDTLICRVPVSTRPIMTTAPASMQIVINRLLRLLCITKGPPLVERGAHRQREIYSIAQMGTSESVRRPPEIIRGRLAARAQSAARAPRAAHSITAWARASNFQNGRFLSSQWVPDRATSAQTNSRAPSVVLNQIDDLWSPSTFHLARDRRSSCRILACHLVAHAKLRLSCGAHLR